MADHVTHAGHVDHLGRSWPFGLVDHTDEPIVAAIVRLRAEGFVGELVPEPNSIPSGVLCRSCGRRHFVDQLHVVAAMRFGGATAADAASIVFTIRCPRCETPGLLISRYGPEVTAEETDLLARIATRAPRD